MGDAAWKAFERRIASVFGGRRRGPDFRGPDGGKSDVVVQGWSVEVKLLSRPSFGDLLAATRQAELAALPDQIPVATIKKKHADDADTLVCIRLETFRAWFLPEGGCEP